MHDAFLAHLQDLFSGFAATRIQPMFGGHGVYAALDGGPERIIGIVIDDTLYLKTDMQTRARFEAAGCAPFVYEKQRQPIATSYWSLPEDALESAQALQPWARLAWEAALRKPVQRRSGRNAKPRN